MCYQRDLSILTIVATIVWVLGLPCVAVVRNYVYPCTINKICILTLTVSYLIYILIGTIVFALIVLYNKLCRKKTEEETSLV